MLPVNQVRKTRTRQACLRCRSRKIRCDVACHERPCTNCRLDHVECIVGGRKKGNGQRSQAGARQGRPRGDTMPQLLDSCQHPTGTPQTNLPDIYCESLPSYIEPPSPHTLESTNSFLSSKGAFRVPVPCVRDLLWKAYVQYVHPSMPLLDLHQFASSVADAGPQTGRISLLLYQAVMLSGFFHVDMKHPLLAGIPSRKAVLDHMFENVKLLYDFDYERDPICIIQSLLLMSHWYRALDDHKDPWHYTGLAVSLAKKIGLYKNSTIAAADARRQPLLRRLWWCCVMRDYMAGYAMGRPTHLTSKECNIPMLMLSDFDIGPITTGNSGLPTDFAAVAEVSVQRQLAVICVEQAKLLAVCHAYQEHLSLEDNSDGLDLFSVFPRASQLDDRRAAVDITAEIETKLANWISDLPEEAIMDDSVKDDAVRVHCGLLHLLYNTAVITIHRGDIIPDRSSDEPSHQRVTQATAKIAGVCRELYQRGLAEYLPVPGTTCILVATVVHLLQISFSGSTPSSETVRTLPMLADILKQLRGRFSYLDYIWKFLEASFEKASKTIDDMKGEFARDGSDVGENATHLDQPVSVDTHQQATLDLSVLRRSRLLQTPDKAADAQQRFGADTAKNNTLIPAFDALPQKTDLFTFDPFGDISTTPDWASDNFWTFPCGETISLFDERQGAAVEDSSQYATLVPPLQTPQGGFGDVSFGEAPDWAGVLADAWDDLSNHVYP